MKLTLLITLGTLISLFSNGQNDGIFDRINGIKIKNNIFVKYDTSQKKFSYQIDKEGNTHYLDDGTYFNVKNSHKNNFKIYLEFYNPLRYSIKSSQRDIDDDAIKAISDFISKLPDALSIATPELSSTVLEKTTNKSFGFDGGLDSKFVNSILLYEWIYKFSELVDLKYIQGKKEGVLMKPYNELLTNINTIKDIELLIFGEIVLKDVDDQTKLKFPDWLKKENTKLYVCENGFKSFDKELTAAGELHTTLKQKGIDAQTKLTKIVAVLSTDFDTKIKPLIANNNSDKIEAFKQYSLGASTSLNTTVSEKLVSQTQALTNFGDLLKKLKTFINNFRGEKGIGDEQFSKVGVRKEFDIKLDWKSKTMKEITFETKGINSEGEEDSKSITGKMIVAKRLGVYPFLSTGIMYTDFSYPNYTVSSGGGTNTVAETDETKVRLRPTVFLNLLITSWDPVYPFFQIGITTGVNDALFPVGAGLAIGSSFSISGGPILGYRKDLTKLKVGDVIKDDAALKSDLSNKGFISWYFSINYNLGKK